MYGMHVHVLSSGKYVSHDVLDQLSHSLAEHIQTIFL